MRPRLRRVKHRAATTAPRVVVAGRAARRRHHHPPMLGRHEAADEVIREIVTTRAGHRTVVTRTTDTRGRCYDVFVRASVPQFSQVKLLALTGTCCTCWQLKHLTFVALPAGAGVSAALGSSAF